MGSSGAPYSSVANPSWRRIPRMRHHCVTLDSRPCGIFWPLEAASFSVRSSTDICNLCAMVAGGSDMTGQVALVVREGLGGRDVKRHQFRKQTRKLFSF